MKKSKVEQLVPGKYRVTWKTGSSIIARVRRDEEGVPLMSTRPLTAWTRGRKLWRGVLSMELLEAAYAPPVPPVMPNFRCVQITLDHPEFKAPIDCLENTIISNDELQSLKDENVELKRHVELHSGNYQIIRDKLDVMRQERDNAREIVHSTVKQVTETLWESIQLRKEIAQLKRDLGEVTAQSAKSKLDCDISQTSLITLAAEVKRLKSENEQLIMLPVFSFDAAARETYEAQNAALSNALKIVRSDHILLKRTAEQSASVLLRAAMEVEAADKLLEGDLSGVRPLTYLVQLVDKLKAVLLDGEKFDGKPIETMNFRCVMLPLLKPKASVNTCSDCKQYAERNCPGGIVSCSPECFTPIGGGEV